MQTEQTQIRLLLDLGLHCLPFQSVLGSNYIKSGVVGWCEGAVYLTSLGRPSDIGLQLGKARYPCSGYG